MMGHFAEETAKKYGFTREAQGCVYERDGDTRHECH